MRERMWKLHFLDLKDPPPTTLQEVLLHAGPLSFPNILTVFRIFGTIPVTTCTCERSTSTLLRLKTYMRSTMGETRLQALALLNVHREIKLDVESVIDCFFARKHPRRKLLADLLNSDKTGAAEETDQAI